LSRAGGKWWSREEREKWRQALGRRSVWKRAGTLGVVVGLTQVAINQGDHWLHHSVNATVIVKSILCPVITFSAALISGAATWVDQQRNDD
jgi:H+/Cl- antiporter ClcA